MELDRIVAELKMERGRLDRAIAALEAVDQRVPVAKRNAVASAASANKKRGGLTAAGRKRLSEAMKKRWAERRKKRS